MSHYSTARKLGERSYREHINRGEFPYLQVLDEILNHEHIVSEVSLGRVEIPADLIVGTYTAGRRTSFAPNFMPLLDEFTEFAMKWETLCEAHVTEGIREPVKAYEYMNRYYIMEGNKRVSVLKFYKASSIAGYVTRIIPRRTDEKENIVYFEYLDFYRHCPVNFLIFTEPGSYREFLDFAGKAPGEDWTESEITDLRSLFARFETAFRKLQEEGRFQNVTVSDALLQYLHLYSYKDSISKLPADYEEILLTVEDEIAILGKEEAVQLVTEDHDNLPGTSFIKKIFSAPEKKLNIAFIYHFTPETSSWTYAHEFGRKYLAETFGDGITTRTYEGVDEESAYEVMEKAVEDGADVIFAAHIMFMSACLKIAVKYPRVRVLDCTYNSPHRYVRAYYARLYEAKFLSGYIAGAMTENDKIGYVTDYPFHMNIANLNAFALGVKSVNPRARVYPQWLGKEGCDPTKFFDEQDIDIVSGMDMANPANPHRHFGLYKRDRADGGHKNLCMALINWGNLYRRIIESIQSGAFDTVDKVSDGRAMNYWLGMASDTVDLLVSDNVSEDIRRMISFLELCIRSNTYRPFYGILTSQDGPVTTQKNDVLSQAEIMNMDWLSDNIEGSLPAMSELTELGKAYVLLENSPAVK